MIRTRGRKIFRDIWSRKARTALVAISIFIGVFGTVTLFSMGDIVVRQMREELEQDRLAMIRAYLAAPPGVEPDNEQVLETLRALPDVTAVEGRLVYPLFWKLPDAEEFQSSYLFSVSEPLDQVQLEPMRRVEGAWPQPGSHELMIERRFADTHDLGVGDQIVVRVLGQSEAGMPAEETWTVSGIAFFSYGYGGFAPIFPEDMVFAGFEDAQYISDSASFSAIYARYASFEAAEVHTDEFNQAIAGSGSYIPAFTFVEDPTENSLILFAQTSNNIMTVLALLALIVSGFLVFNVLMAIVTEQRQQIGIMKAVGASASDNFLIYSGMAFIYGLIAVIPAVLLGIPAGYLAAQGYAASANLALIEDFTISVPAIVIGVLVGLAVPVLASLLPVYNSTRVQIREALTDLGIAGGYGHGPLARLVERLPLPLNVRQGFSNTIRKKGRIALTVVTLTFAAGAFMGVFAVFTSVNDVVNEFFEVFGFHFTLDPKEIEQLDQARALMEEQYPDLTSRGPYVSQEIRIDGYDKEYNAAAGPPALFANGYDPASDAYNFNFLSGENLEPGDSGVILSRSVANGMNRQVGDTITIRAGGSSGEYTITGIVSYPYDGVWFDWQELARLSGFVTPDGEPRPTSWLWEMSGSDITASEVDDRTDEVNELLLANGIGSAFSNIELTKETISNAVRTFQAVFNTAALLIALVGAVGLLTTLSMSVYERQKEIGVMRSIGAGSLTIIGQFMTEGLVVGLLAWLLGLPLSYLLNAGLISVLDLGTEYQLGYPIEAAVFGLVGVLVITALASVWPSINAARKTVSDILRYQ